MTRVLFLLLVTCFAASAYTPPKWTEKERGYFIKECTKLGNTHRYCVCFSTYLEETSSPKKMLALLKEDSNSKQEADNECKFNNKLEADTLQYESL